MVSPGHGDDGPGPAWPHCRHRDRGRGRGRVAFRVVTGQPGRNRGSLNCDLPELVTGQRLSGLGSAAGFTLSRQP